MTIRPLDRSDYDQWLPLWQENCEHKIADKVTAETWRRLCHKKESVCGLGCFDETGALLGFLHYVVHATTGYIEPACYMQDIYIATEHRKCGYAKRLIWELRAIATAQNWSRVYWFAENNNLPAQNLYKTLGIKLNFSLHMMQIKEIEQ